MYVIIYIYIHNSQAELVQWGGFIPHVEGTAAVIYAPPPQYLNLFCFLLFLGSSQTPQFSACQLQLTSWGPTLVKAPSGFLCICTVPTSPHPGPGRRISSQGWVLSSIHPFTVVHCLYMVEEYFKPLFKSLYGSLIHVGKLVLIKTIPPTP